MLKLTNPRFPKGLEDMSVEDRRNVIDPYRYWEDDAIKAALDEQRRPFSVLLENFGNDFNIGTVIRNCNAFLADGIWVTGRKRFNRRGAMCTDLYQHLYYAKTTEEVIREQKKLGMRVVVLDNIDGASDMRDYQWNPETLMVFGQESIGVSQTALDLADNVVYIPQFGSTRSLNVGCASGIAMYDYAAKVPFSPR
jgi:tRNA G18 (ribose-2'-O)-methylase SpoU